MRTWYVMMGRVLVLMGLLLGGVVPSGWAQSDAADGAASGGGFFAVGAHGTALDGLNTRLRAEGYPAVATTLVAVGGGGYGVVADRFLIGGEGYGLAGPSRTTGGRTISAGGGYGVFTVGYQFRPAPRWRLHPLLGLGGGGVQLEIGSTGAETFDDVLQDPDRSATLTSGQLLVSVGFGAEWTLGDETVAGGPDATLGGPFARIHVGGWGD